jgi:hypothetical protein
MACFKGNRYASLQKVGSVANLHLGNKGVPIAPVIQVGRFLGIGGKKVTTDAKSLQFVSPERYLASGFVRQLRGRPHPLLRGRRRDGGVTLKAGKPSSLRVRAP